MTPAPDAADAHAVTIAAAILAAGERIAVEIRWAANEHSEAETSTFAEHVAAAAELLRLAREAP